MTEVTEHMMEYTLAGVLFGLAFFLVIQFQKATMNEISSWGRAPERLILFEETEE